MSSCEVVLVSLTAGLAEATGAEMATFCGEDLTAATGFLKG